MNRLILKQIAKEFHISRHFIFLHRIVFLAYLLLIVILEISFVPSQGAPWFYGMSLAAWIALFHFVIRPFWPSLPKGKHQVGTLLLSDNQIEVNGIAYNLENLEECGFFLQIPLTRLSLFSEPKNGCCYLHIKTRDSLIGENFQLASLEEFNTLNKLLKGYKEILNERFKVESVSEMDYVLNDQKTGFRKFV